MLILAENHEPESIIVRDVTGRAIPYITSYDTDTCEVEMIICVGFEGNRPVFMMQKVDDYLLEIVKVKLVVEGSYATDKHGNVLK